MNVFEYVVACVHLYGMIHEDRILRIYNKHHPKKQMNHLPEFDMEKLNYGFVHYDQGFYIHQAIFFNNDMAQHLEETNGKPYYIPKEDELSKYLDDGYFERNASVIAIEAYIKKNLLTDNDDGVEELLEEIVLASKDGVKLNYILEYFERYGIFFEEEQIKDILRLLTDVYNNCKIWLNNGFSPIELSIYHKRYQETKRNDLCPCQSGKKFKHCCMNKGHIDDDLGQLVYENVFTIKEEERNRFRNALLFHMEKLNDDFLTLENPSYKDFVQDFIYGAYETYQQENHKVLAGAIIRSLLVFHKVDQLEERFEDILRQLKVWSQRNKIISIQKNIDDIFFANNKLANISGLYIRVMSVLKDLSYNEKTIYIDEDDYNKLLVSLEENPYDEGVTAILTDLSFDILDSDIDDKVILFLHLLQVTPYLPQTISMLLDYQIEDEPRINLIKAYIKAYETVNKDDFIEPMHEFTRYKDHKEYILALDSLAYMYKRMNMFNQAIELYQKMAYYDDEDRFCAHACSLMCYVKLNQMDDFDRVFKGLEEDSLYKVFLNLLFKLMKDEDFQEVYQKAYNKSPGLLDVLCQFKDISDDTIPPLEREFIEDFYGLFNEDPSIISKLKQTHENHKLMVS